MKHLKRDVDFIKSVLPKHYLIKDRTHGVFCISMKGIDNEKEWEIIFDAIRAHFGDRLQEVYHTVCHNHTEFTIYFMTNLY